VGAKNVPWTRLSCEVEAKNVPWLIPSCEVEAKNVPWLLPSCEVEATDCSTTSTSYWPSFKSGYS